MKRFPLYCFVFGLLCLAAAGVIEGCASPAVTTDQTNNPNFQVDFLFENDGVKVYRFWDKLQYHYYADARGKTMSFIPKGKNSQVADDIPTVDQ